MRKAVGEIVKRVRGSKKNFKKILVANRGEIASRILRSLRECGMETVAVYSDEDVFSPHVYGADFAVNIGSAEPSLSYLNIEKIVGAAKKVGACAIHPGYGFLAENSLFVRACEKNSIVFIGPPAEAMKSMGDKIASRIIMKKAGVPIIPGTTKAVNLEAARKEAKKLGYPILLKATAGGGGKGMRRVAGEKELREAFELASSEAKKSFGNPTLYLEKFIENPRHVEVQILADHYGNVTHVYNRECSIQRRHQKIVEEAPAPNLSSRTTEKMFEVAMKASKAIGYTNAGTVEFIVDEKEDFYFLEMNTRLQVEHPATEMITGLDLVKEQVKIASGEKLFAGGGLPEPRGFSIECRIYAEDPLSYFAPSPGRIEYVSPPGGPFVRVDSGIWKGSNISLYYDPLIAKLITFGTTREEAIKRMGRALSEYKIVGVQTNIQFLKWVIRSERFEKGKVNTNFIEEEGPYTAQKTPPEEIDAVLAALGNYGISRDIRKESSRESPQGSRRTGQTKLTNWQHSFMFENNK